MQFSVDRGVQVFIAVCDFLGVPHELTLLLANVATQRDMLRALADHLKVSMLEQERYDTLVSTTSQKANDLMIEIRTSCIQPIVKMGRRILTSDPELQAVIKVSELTSYEATMLAALELAGRVEPFKAQFVAAGFKEDFVEIIRAKVNELQSTLEEKREHIGRRSRATAAIQADYARGKDLVRILDVMVSMAWKSKPDLLAQWKSVSNMPSPKRSKTPKPAPAPVVTSPETPVVQGEGKAATDSNVA